MDWRAVFQNDLLQQAGWKAARIGVLLVAAGFATWLMRRFVDRVNHAVARLIKGRNGALNPEAAQRASSVAALVSSAIIIGIWCLAAIWTLEQLGLDITPLLAGAGIAGLAIGFGAQNLVRDVITGLILFLENQIRLGDIVIINGTRGKVEHINLRTLVLRSTDGAVHVFPNGSVSTTTNLTRDFSYAIVDAEVDAQENTDRVGEVMQQAGDEVRADPAFAPRILDRFEVLGVERTTEYSVVMRGRMQVRPGEQWSIGRELNRRIKLHFDEARIANPSPLRNVSLDATSRPIRVELDPSTRELLVALLALRKPDAGKD